MLQVLVQVSLRYTDATRQQLAPVSTSVYCCCCCCCCCSLLMLMMMII